MGFVVIKNIHIFLTACLCSCYAIVSARTLLLQFFLTINETKMELQITKNPFAFVTFVFAMFVSSGVRGQDIYPAATIKIPKANPEMIKKISLQASASHKNELVEEFKNFHRRLKQKSINNLSNNFITPAQKKPGICPPLVQTGFEGNPQSQLYLLPVGYGPSECDIAISNAGTIVSISNTWIRYYNENGSLIFSDSLYHFGNSIIDVHVLYDPKADRFVFCSSYGYYNRDPFILNTQGTLIGFSKSNDPMDGWNLYQLPFTDFHDKYQ